MSVVALLLAGSSHALSGDNPTDLTPTVHLTESSVDLQIVEKVESLRKRSRVLSPLSIYFSEQQIVGVLQPQSTHRWNDSAIDSPEHVAITTHTGIILAPDKESLSEITAYAANNDLVVSGPRDGTLLIYPKVLADPINRELFLLRALDRMTDETMAVSTDKLNTARTKLAESEASLQQIGKQELALKTLTDKAAELERSIAVAVSDADRLQQELIDWIKTVSDPFELESVNKVEGHYDPTNDPSVPVLDEHMVKLDKSKTPYRDWDGTNGVPTPYLDRETSDQLKEFYQKEATALKEIGAEKLEIESAARTPVRGMHLRASGNKIAVGPYNSNHLIGTAVDFVGAPSCDYLASGLSPAEAKTRKDNYSKLKGLLAKHRLVLGTTGANRKFDPMHATLDTMAKPDSKERLARVAAITQAYGDRYRRVIEIAEAKEQAGTAQAAATQNALSMMDNLVQGASKKCKDLEGQLGGLLSKNASMKQQIEGCKKTYQLLQQAREKKKHSGSGMSEREIADKIRRGEDISKDVEKAFHDTFDRMAHENSRCEGSFDGKEFQIRCEKGEKPRGGDRAPDVKGGIRG